MSPHEDTSVIPDCAGAIAWKRPIEPVPVHVSNPLVTQLFLICRSRFPGPVLPVGAAHVPPAEPKQDQCQDHEALAGELERAVEATFRCNNEKEDHKPRHSSNHRDRL